MTDSAPTPHLPLSERITEDLLGRLWRREITSTAAANQLNVSLTHLSRTLSGAGFKKLASQAVEGRAEASQARQKRTSALQKAAKQVLEGTKNLEKACDAMGCSERTMFRYMKAEKKA